MTFLVTGATGKAGGHVLRHLREEGHLVRVLTRDASRADLPGDVDVVEGDLTRPDTLGRVFAGVVGAHLLTCDGDYAALTTGEEIARLAEEAGVRRVTLLWNGGPGPVEQAFAGSTVEWTRLEPVTFMGNTLAWVDGIRDRETVEEPFVDGAETVVDERDVGAVSARILVDGGHHRRTYTLTGPEPVSARERLAMLSRVLGRDLRLVELDEPEARSRWRQAGHAEEMIETLVRWHRDPPATASAVSPDVETILGRPGQSFTTWAEAHADAFR